MNLHRFPDAPSTSRGCAVRVLELLTTAVQERGAAAMAVSGGTSPKLMFEMFAGSGFAWERVHLFFVDERVVPPTDPESNFKLANDTWLSQCAFPTANIHRIPAELGAEEAARAYREDILRHFSLQPGEAPRFDVIHRGMGPDSHTASLFPGEPLITNARSDIAGLAAAVWVEKMHQWRVTLLPAVLEAARHTVMLVTGADKASALQAVLNGPYDPMRHPAQIARDSAEWFVDQASEPA